MRSEEVLAAGGPWYGLPGSIETRRMYHGCGRSGDVLSLTLSHDWGTREVVVEVQTHTGLRSDEQVEWSARINLLLRSREFRDPKAGDYPLRVVIEREERTVRVDDEEVSFVVLRIGDDWVANGVVNGRAVEAHAVGYPLEAFTLAAVDPGDYWSPPDAGRI